MALEPVSCCAINGWASVETKRRDHVTEGSRLGLSVLATFSDGAELPWLRWTWLLTWAAWREFKVWPRPRNSGADFCPGEGEVEVPWLPEAELILWETHCSGAVYSLLRSAFFCIFYNFDFLVQWGELMLCVKFQVRGYSGVEMNPHWDSWSFFIVFHFSSFAHRLFTLISRPAVGFCLSKLWSWGSMCCKHFL